MADNAETIVKDLAKLVLVSGKISDIHEKNMKMYALVFFEGVKELKIDYDLSHEADALLDKDNNLTINSPKRSNRVSYYLTMTSELASNTEWHKNLDRRFAALEASIATLFWKGITVEVFFNDRSVYKSIK